MYVHSVHWNYQLLASGHKEHKHMMAVGMCASLFTQDLLLLLRLLLQLEQCMLGLQDIF